ncbi:MAG TPA: BMC domain-containing protein [Planctomycetota bacterium]|nr:BMC domain-containing protein [Planctomycetota bacterium]
MDENPAVDAKVRPRPCIGILEHRSIARGIEVADAILKEASVEMLFSEPVHPGKYVSLFTGDVEDVRSALRRGAEAAAEDLLDETLIPDLHPGVIPAVGAGAAGGPLDALGVIETFTVASALLAADRAAKRSTVRLLRLRLANGLGGKCVVTLTGEVSDVRAAVEAGARAAEERRLLVREVVIPRPHADLARYLG